MLAFIVSATLREVFDKPLRKINNETPYGNPTAPIEIHVHNEIEYAVLFRHGVKHWVPAHLVNYRANIWALRDVGVDKVLAFATTGSIDPQLNPGDYVVPDQIIDYSYERIGSFDREEIEEHFDFTYPFTKELRAHVLTSAHESGLNFQPEGTYACMQGPRLETAAEIRRAGQDGCSIVGMTLMPEAALARQIELEYASLVLVTNYGAGIRGDIDHDTVAKLASEATKLIRRFNENLLNRLY